MASPHPQLPCLGHTRTPDLPSGRQVLKVAILAEKYAVDYSWYVDTILNLIRIAGDYVSEEVWYRVLQIVTNRDDVQGNAAKTVFEVSAPVSPHDGASGQSQDSWGCGASWLGPHPQRGWATTSQCEGQQGTGCLLCSHWSLSAASFPRLPPQTRGPIQFRFILCVSSV